MMSQERIEAIRKRAEKATDGPWTWGFKEGFEDSPPAVISRDVPTPTVGAAWDAELFSGVYERASDAEFCAEARTDIPDLLAYIALLVAVVEAARTGDPWAISETLEALDNFQKGQSR